MKKPGANPWKEFCHYLKDMGFSPDQLKHMYQRHKDELARREKGAKPEETEYEAILRKKRKSDERPEETGTGSDSRMPSASGAYAGPHSGSETVNMPFSKNKDGTLDLNRCAKASGATTNVSTRCRNLFQSK